MPADGIPERVKNFLYYYVDSIELLEVLLVFHENREKPWSAQSLSVELRSTPSSIEKRILFLSSLGVLTQSRESTGEYFYDSGGFELGGIIEDVASAYRIQRHKVIELIFSPMKKARDFADAFRWVNSLKNGRDDE